MRRSVPDSDDVFAMPQLWTVSDVEASYVTLGSVGFIYGPLLECYRRRQYLSLAGYQGGISAIVVISFSPAACYLFLDCNCHSGIINLVR